jgi:hypothetical protein
MEACAMTSIFRLKENLLALEPSNGFEIEPFQLGVTFGIGPIDAAVLANASKFATQCGCIFVYAEASGDNPCFIKPEPSGL